MSNETKRELFKTRAYDCAGVNYELYKQYLNQYDDALPDDLPVIPKKVSQEIKATYTKYGLMDVLNWTFQDAIDPEVAYWIGNNEALFAEAWGRGLWIVEQTGKVESYD